MEKAEAQAIFHRFIQEQGWRNPEQQKTSDQSLNLAITTLVAHLDVPTLIFALKTIPVTTFAASLIALALSQVGPAAVPSLISALKELRFRLHRRRQVLLILAILQKITGESFRWFPVRNYQQWCKDKSIDISQLPVGDQILERAYIAELVLKEHPRSGAALEALYEAMISRQEPITKMFYAGKLVAYVINASYPEPNTPKYLLLQTGLKEFFKCYNIMGPLEQKVAEEKMPFDLYRNLYERTVKNALLNDGERIKN